MNYNVMLKAIAAPMKLHQPGEAPVSSSERFRSFSGNAAIPPDIKLETARAYCEVFAEPPWNEGWSLEEVEKKINRETAPPSCLTIMKGNEEFPVGGFCWSGIVPVEFVTQRTITAHGFSDPSILPMLEMKMRETIKREKIFFLDEVAIMREFRSGMSPIQFLVRPSLEVAVGEGAIEGLGWTSWKSKIAPLSLYLGFSKVVAEVEGIAFLYNPDIRPLLKIAQNVNGEFLERIIRTASRLIGRKAA